MTVAWDPSPTPDVTGYNVYYGVSGGSTSKLTLGNQTSTSISGLEPGKSYSFCVTAVNAYGESDPSTEVTHKMNSAPVASGFSVNTYRDQPVGIILIGSDEDGDSLTYEVINLPAHGVLQGSPPNLTYTPEPGYFGPDSLTFKVGDGEFDSAPATVDIAVLDAPGLDLTPPFVAINSPAPGSTVSGVVTISITAADETGVSSVAVWINGAPVGNASPMAGGSTWTLNWNTAAGPDGTAKLQAKASDAAGNVGASSEVIVTVVQNDLTPPQVGIVAPAPSSTVSGTVQVEILASDDSGLSSVACVVNGLSLGTATTSPALFLWDTTKLADGTYQIRAGASDGAGNMSFTSINVNVSNGGSDSTPPVVTISEPGTGAILSGTAAITAQATDDREITTAELSVDGQLITSSTESSVTFQLDTTVFTDGMHTIKVAAYDAAGNSGSASIQVEVRNSTAAGDSTPPAVVITSPQDGEVVKKNFSVKVGATDDVGVLLVELYMDGALAISSTSSTASFTVNYRKLSAGDHTFVAKAYDGAGNEGTSAPVTIRK